MYCLDRRKRRKDKPYWALWGPTADYAYSTLPIGLPYLVRPQRRFATLVNTTSYILIVSTTHLTKVNAKIF